MLFHSIAGFDRKLITGIVPFTVSILHDYLMDHLPYKFLQGPVLIDEAVIEHLSHFFCAVTVY